MDCKTCCFTGHRRLPEHQLALLRQRLRDAVLSLYAAGVTHYRVGGAVGFDTLAAEVLAELREQHPDLDISLYVPFPGYTDGWSEEELADYENLLPLFQHVVMVCDRRPKSPSYAFLKRNRKMVDGSVYVIAFCGRKSGGSAYTLRYGSYNHGLRDWICHDTVSLRPLLFLGWRHYTRQLRVSQYRQVGDCGGWVQHSVFCSAPAILYRASQNCPLQYNSGHSQANMVTDVYAHINNKDRQRLAVMVNDCFFSEKNPQFTPPAPEETETKEAPSAPELSPEITSIIEMLQKNEGMATAMMGMLKCMM